ncbi:MAG: DnaJ domain-containing protein [bacterium]|nr:DnaJ domain-containing protein [bacterium]
MNMERPPTPPSTPRSEEPPEDKRNFDSKDPFEFLGVDRNATDDEINKARRRTQREFHEDARSTNPRAPEFFKKAVEAQKKISEYKKPRNAAPTPPVEKSVYVRMGESTILKGLSLDPKDFGKTKLTANKLGVTSEKVAELIHGPEAQDRLRRGVDTFTEAHRNDSSEKFAQQAATYIQEWATHGIHVGIDLFTGQNRASIENLVTRTAEDMYWFKKAEFKPFVEGWISSGWQPNQKILDFLKTI